MKRSSLKSGRSTGNPTKANRERFRDIQAIGCIACGQDGRWLVPCDIHHLLSGGRRIGHHATVGLCPWHHRGNPPDGYSIAVAAFRFGPSLAHEPRAFRIKYGNEDAILAKQNELLATIRRLAA